MRGCTIRSPGLSPATSSLIPPLFYRSPTCARVPVNVRGFLSSKERGGNGGKERQEKRISDAVLGLGLRGRVLEKIHGASAWVFISSDLS